MTLPPTLDREVIPNARPGTTWGNAVLLTQDLDKPAGLTTFPQDNDNYDDRALYYESHPATPADAALRVPLLTRHTPHGCPTFIPAFTSGTGRAKTPRAARIGTANGSQAKKYAAMKKRIRCPVLALRPASAGLCEVGLCGAAMLGMMGVLSGRAVRRPAQLA
jgi:hypothetical protein